MKKLRRGFVVYNGFWNDSPPDTVNRLVGSGKKFNLELMPAANNECCVIIDSAAENGYRIYFYHHEVSKADLVIFMDKDIRLCEALEGKNIRVFNASKAISVCDDKSATHLALAQHGIPMPKTLFAPLTYRKMGADKWESYLKLVIAELGFPFVLKECYGSLGGQVYLIKSEEAFFERLETVQPRSFLCQKFISATAGSDIRIYIVGGVAVASMKRFSADGDFRANVGNGGKGENFTPTEAQLELALRCYEILGLDFAGIDLLIDENGEALICEVNSNAQMSEITKCTGIEVSDKIIEYILND